MCGKFTIFISCNIDGMWMEINPNTEHVQRTPYTHFDPIHWIDENATGISKAFFVLFHFSLLFYWFYGNKSGENECNCNRNQSESDHKYVESFLSEDIREGWNIIIDSLNDVHMTSFLIFIHCYLLGRVALSYQILALLLCFCLDYSHLFFHWRQRWYVFVEQL